MSNMSGKPPSYSYSYSTSKSSTSTTSNKNRKPQTYMETVTSSSANGEPTKLQYNDNFEELKRSVLSGDAYKKKVGDITARPGLPHYKPQSGLTVIRPVRSEALQTTARQYHPVGRERSLIMDDSTSPSDMNSLYKTELHIPVQRHHDTFDNFFMNRWHEHNNSLMDTEFDRRRMDWESKLDGMKRDFFHFSPFNDPGHQLSIDAGKAIQSSPSGKPEFAVQFDVKDFKPEEVNVSTKDGKLVIAAAHEEKHGHSTSRREFKRTVDLPKDIQIGLMKSVLSRDGILSITAPINPPDYKPALTSSSQVKQQHATALSTMPSSHVVERVGDSKDSLNYSMSILGYLPEEVKVTVQGRKVTVNAKHDELVRGRKTHNEMTKSFDLPASVDPRHVRSYIKDGTTLHIEAHLRDDLSGKIHVVPVHHK